MVHVAALLAVLASQTEGRLEIGGNLSVRYHHVFNRNAIADARVAGDAVVALTPGGMLLELTLPELELVDVVYPKAPIVSLGADAGGGLLAADVDGGIHRVDAATMTLVPVGRVASRPAAVGAYRASPGASESIVVVTGQEVHDLGTGRVWKLDYLASGITTHVDRATRLWIGADRGEWGGWVARLDLIPGELKMYSDCLTESEDGDRPYEVAQFRCEGVHGFTELDSGAMWAHGGTTHLGTSSAWIARLDDAGITPLFENRHSSWGEVRRTEKPRSPIAHVVEHPTNDALYLFSFDEVFRSDRMLGRFQLAYKLDVEGYRSTSSVDWLAGANELLVATARDGFVRLRDGHQREHAFAGDLGATRIDRMERTGEGIAFYDEAVVWEQSAGDWKVKALEPRAGPSFDLSELKAYAIWQTQVAFVDASADLIAVSETNLSPGPRATVRWRNDTPTVLKVENEPEGYFVSGFATPDGELWAASSRGLYRFSESGWTHVAAITMDENAGFPRLRALTTAGPPWFVLERTSGELFQLSYEGRQTRLRPVPDKGVRLEDAVRTRDGWLFATSAGLRTYDFERRVWSDVDLGVDASAVRQLIVDDGGRLWLGGDGLWVVVNGRARDLSAIPALSGVEVVAIIADPHRREGVIVSLGERGLLYVATE